MAECDKAPKRLSPEEAAALIKAIEEVEREEATQEAPPNSHPTVDPGTTDKDSSKVA